jgi:hypothetical protein
LRKISTPEVVFYANILEGGKQLKGLLEHRRVYTSEEERKR